MYTGWQGLSMAWTWGSLRPAMGASFIALLRSQWLAQTGNTSSYGSNLFNYARYQVWGSNLGCPSLR